MVIGLLIVAGIPTTIGVCEALSAQKKANNAAKEKAKFHMTAIISLDGKTLEECWVVLKDGHLWLDHPDYPVPGHKFTGYYFTYPSEEKHLGMVSTIADDPPMLNWIYVDKESGLVRHGGRQATLGHTIGPWHWSEDEKRLTLEEDDASFIAVWMKEAKRWAVAYDPEGTIQNGNSETEEEASSESEEESEEDSEEEDDKNKARRKAKGNSRPKWAAIRLNRMLQFGMESKYVKGANAQQ